jgi:ATP-dependent Lhr-like helicase
VSTPPADGPARRHDGIDAADDLDPALLYHVVNTLGWPDLRPLQRATIAPVLRGEHALVLAPTAGGKTEAALFPLLSRMARESWAPLSVLYVCPLRALLNNLHPRVERYAGFLGRRAGLWHGDVTSAPRRRIVTDPPDILLTTPESIEAMLVSSRVDHRHLFAHVRAVVVDEIHAFAGDDRGWHLLAVLERVARCAGRDLQRIGLSATVGNPDALLRWLRGAGRAPGRVVAPKVGAPADPQVEVDHVGSLSNAATLISKLHRGEKRLVFVDSKSVAEHLTAELRSRHVATFVSHAALSRDERHQAEQAFAEATDCVIVATSTLELGIDVGDLDRVIQIGAPGTVASFLQRLGRTGRRPGARRNCLFLSTRDDELLKALGLCRLWSQGDIEPIEPPAEPAHLVAQQLLAAALQERRAGGVGRRTWPDAAAQVPELGRIAALVGDDLVEHLLATGMVIDDQGMLSIGPEGERSYGFRHFTQLTTSFASEPWLTVLHGRQQLGSIHPISIERRDDRPTVLLLGGRAWRVRQVDWRRRQVFVQASDSGGRSRWVGGGRPLSAALCRAMRAVLAGVPPGVTLSRRATAALDTLRGTHWWAKDGTTTVVSDAAAKVTWWTFAGTLANRQLAAVLGLTMPLGSRPTDLSIELMPGTSAGQITGMLARLPDELPPAPAFPDALAGLKFSDCLPEGLAAQTLGWRFSDPQSVRTVATEPVTTAHLTP